MREPLAALARQFGIQRCYRAASGEQVQASEDAVRAVLVALGAAADHNAENLLSRQSGPVQTPASPLEPVVLAWDARLADVRLRVSSSAARRAMRYEIQLEAGDVISGDIPVRQRRIATRDPSRRSRAIELVAELGLALPIGYHQLRIDTADGAGSALIIAAPRRCYSGDRPREWGVFAPLYGLRESADQAIGELRDLESLMSWIAQLDGDFVATLPISAAFLREPFDPSPYSPASRLFWNEIYLNSSGRPAAVEPTPELVDYRATAAQKRAALQSVAERFFASSEPRSPAFREFLRLYPDARDYAAFRAAGDHFATGWGAWPARPRAGKLLPGDYARTAHEFHLYAQFAAHQQLSTLAGHARGLGVRLYLDLPLGVHPDSYDIWRNRDLFLTDASAGAPPDPFFTNGQNWGFPPLHPQRLRLRGYDYWRKVLRTQLRYAGMLRLDHVMSLHRLYVIPAGFPARQGVYIRYPSDELFATLALESQRHQAAIVGEDLGTVPAEVRKSMARHGVKRMFVVQFEATEDSEPPLGPVPRDAVASLNTHDMPPFRAYWEAGDADLRRELGLLDEEGVAALRESRARTARALSRMLGSPGLLEARAAHDALVRMLARGPADAVLLNLEDLWLESAPQNVPGTSQERPNWRRRLKFTLQELRTDGRVREVLASVERARRSPDGKA